jgi:hypothetical protein
MPTKNNTSKKPKTNCPKGTLFVPHSYNKPLEYGQCYPVTKPKNKPSNVPKMGEPSKKRKTRRNRK